MIKAEKWAIFSLDLGQVVAGSCGQTASWSDFRCFDCGESPKSHRRKLGFNQWPEIIGTCLRNIQHQRSAMATLAEDTDEEIWLREMLIARFHVDTGQTMSLFTPKCVVYAYLDAKLGMVGSVRSRAQHWDTPVQNMIASMLIDSPRFELDCPITYAIDPNRPRNTRYRKCRAFRYIAPKSLTGVPPAFRAKFKAVFQDNDASIASRVRERAVVNRPVQPCIADQQPEPSSPQHGNEGEEAVRHSGDEWWESGDEELKETAAARPPCPGVP